MKNVYLISIDCLRSDYTGLSENDKLIMPNLLGLAIKGYAYPNCIVHAPFTTASHASMLSGLLPFQHGVRHLYNERLSKNITMIQHDMKDLGYEAIGMVSCYHMSHIGLEQGFDYFTFKPSINKDKKGRSLYVPADKLVNRAINRVKLNDNPKFVFLHFFDAHVNIGDEYEAIYKEELLKIDKEIERLVDSDPDALFVITSDHGKKWIGEHNFPYLNPRNKGTNPLLCEYKGLNGGHGGELYDEAMRVPLVVYNGVREENFPNEIFHSKGIRRLIGREVLISEFEVEIFDIRYKIERDNAYIETFSPENLFQGEGIPLIGLRTNEYKFIGYCSPSKKGWIAGPGELYNIVKDPKEEHDIIEEDDSWKMLFKKIGEIMAIEVKQGEPIEDKEYQDTIKERLEGMGYI